jgi:hypothetical protein
MAPSKKYLIGVNSCSTEFIDFLYGIKNLYEETFTPSLKEEYVGNGELCQVAKLPRSLISEATITDC